MFEMTSSKPTPTGRRAIGQLVAISMIAWVGLAIPASAQSAEADIATLPDRVMFVISGGVWQGETGLASGEDAEPATVAPDATLATGSADAASGQAEASAPSKRGYYRLSAVRGEDNRARIFLQEITLSTTGPDVSLTVEVEELSALRRYVTDLRTEDPSGLPGQPGFAGYVFLKADPAATEPEIWTVFVDEFGEIAVSKASN